MDLLRVGGNLLGRNPWPLILYGDEVFPAASLQRDGNGSSLRRILVRVREQIQERLTDVSWIYLSLEMVITRLKGGSDTRACQVLIDNRTAQFREIGGGVVQGEALRLDERGLL